MNPLKPSLVLLFSFFDFGNSFFVLVGTKRRFGLGYGVVSASSPRVATQYSFDCKPKSFERSVFLYRFECVLRTSGCESASCRGVWRNRSLIKPYKKNEKPRKDFLNRSHGLFFLLLCSGFRAFVSLSVDMWVVVLRLGLCLQRVVCFVFRLLGV